MQDEHLTLSGMMNGAITMDAIGIDVNEASVLQLAILWASQGKIVAPRV